MGNHTIVKHQSYWKNTIWFWTLVQIYPVTEFPPHKEEVRQSAQVVTSTIGTGGKQGGQRGLRFLSWSPGGKKSCRPPPTREDWFCEFMGLECSISSICFTTAVNLQTCSACFIPKFRFAYWSLHTCLLICTNTHNISLTSST